MNEKEREKDATIALAHQILAKAHPDGATVIKHWITIIQARWDEVSTWAKQVGLKGNLIHQSVKTLHMRTGEKFSTEL